MSIHSNKEDIDENKNQIKNEMFINENEWKKEELKKQRKAEANEGEDIRKSEEEVEMDNINKKRKLNDETEELIDLDDLDNLFKNVEQELTTQDYKTEIEDEDENEEDEEMVANDNGETIEERAKKYIETILEKKNSSPFDIFDLEGEIELKIVNKRFRRLSLLIHPDKCKHEKASEAFNILKDAYEKLKDEQMKETYVHVYEKAKQNILKKQKAINKKDKGIKDYLNLPEEDVELTDETRRLIHEECNRLLKIEEEEKEYAMKCKLANMKYIEEKEQDKYLESLQKEKEHELMQEGKEERMKNWKEHKNEIHKDMKEFNLYKGAGKKECRTEEQMEELKKAKTNAVGKNASKKRKV